jgi:AcrR family transcriptional regulator
MSRHSAPGGGVPRGQVRKRVVSAATELFARQGYETTTIRQIVTEARVTQGALYHWFSSKEELLTSIYTDLLADQIRRLERISASPEPAAERLREAAFDLVAHRRPWRPTRRLGALGPPGARSRPSQETSARSAQVGTHDAKMVWPTSRSSWKARTASPSVQLGRPWRRRAGRRGVGHGGCRSNQEESGGYVLTCANAGLPESAD